MLGSRLAMRQRAVGSLLAAVGTALPDLVSTPDVKLLLDEAAEGVDAVAVTILE